MLLPIVRNAAAILAEHGFCNCSIVQVLVSAPGHPDVPRLQFRQRISLNGAGAISRDDKETSLPQRADLVSLNGAMRRRGRDFSPLEEAILKVTTDDWQTKSQIAARCGMKASTSFSAILSNLAERGWIESSRQGYRFPPV